jgi:sugar lactone lactonase YvrE
VDKDNNVWIASSPSGMVQKYTHDGRTLLLQIGKKGVVDSSDGTVKGTPLNSNAAIFFMPSSIQVDRQNGDVIGAFGRAGTFPGQFNQPHGIAVDSRGNIYIAENRGRRIHKFSIATE